ncbi:MAG: hypothetical protein HY791_22050 [Deltaproteobacteria bacterium]|nr:hypothetical protein [Deltaproteobacteria bacterium]
MRVGAKGPTQAPGRQEEAKAKGRSEAGRLDTVERGPGTGHEAPKVGKAAAFEVGRSPLGLSGLKAPRAVFEAIERAVAGVKTMDELTARVTELGFGLALTQPEEKTRFLRGSLELDVRSYALADFAAFSLDLDGPRGFEAKAGLLEGVVIPKPQLDGIRAKYDETLEEFGRALEAAGSKSLPTTLDNLKDFLELGLSKDDRAKERAQDAEIEAALGKIATELKLLEGTKAAPRGVIVYVDGPDGAGKSSTGAIVMKALASADFEIRAEAFKAPTAEERGQHWLKRFERGVPDAGQAVYWDRGPAGDAAYGQPDSARQKRMARDLAKFEKDLQKQGVLFFKLELFADGDKQAETFGKRIARREIASRITQNLAARGTLDEVKANGLEGIRGKIDADDVSALAKFDEVQARFENFAKISGESVGAGPWHLVDASKRHAARLEVISGMRRALAEFTETRA